MHTIQPTARPANDNRATFQTSRRALLGGAGIAAALAAAPIAAAALPASPAPTDEWDRLVVRFKTLRAIENHLVREYSRRESDWFKVRDTLPPAPSAPRARFGTDMTLAELRDATDDPEYVAAWAEYEREKAAWQAMVDARKAEVMGDIEKAEGQARSIAVNALAAIRDYPASSFAMVEQKAEIIGTYYADQLEQRDIAAIMADIRRLNRDALA